MSFEMQKLGNSFGVFFVLDLVILKLFLTVEAGSPELFSTF